MSTCHAPNSWKELYIQTNPGCPHTSPTYGLTGGNIPDFLDFSLNNLRETSNSLRVLLRAFRKTPRASHALRSLLWFLYITTHREGGTMPPPLELESTNHHTSAQGASPENSQSCKPLNCYTVYSAPLTLSPRERRRKTLTLTLC